MTRCTRLAALVPAALCAGAAKGDEAWIFAGVFPAAVLLLALPAALLLHGWKPGWLASMAGAYGRRKTATALIGAGLGIFLFLLVGSLASAGAEPLAMLLFIASCAYLVVGLAGCARRQGLRMLGLGEDVSGEDEQRMRPVVIGWLCRAGAFAVPLLWPFIGAYLVATALGAPVVAWLEARRARG